MFYIKKTRLINKKTPLTLEIKATQVKPSKEQYFLYLNNTDDPKPFRKTSKSYYSNKPVRGDSEVMFKYESIN